MAAPLPLRMQPHRDLLRTYTDADIHNATVVTLYLLPNVNVRLRPKLLAELKPGTRVVSHSFGMGDWKPDKEEIVDGNSVYLWTIPDKK